jgi:mitogen-activated protein kinase kinase kinase 9
MFKEILSQLDSITRSGFMQTPHASFHTMQDNWKKEIAEVLQELRIKEKVSRLGGCLAK